MSVTRKRMVALHWLVDLLLVLDPYYYYVVFQLTFNAICCIPFPSWANVDYQARFGHVRGPSLTRLRSSLANRIDVNKHKLPAF